MKIKKALLICTLCLFVCFTMLIGTTFAWFTDSVSSGKNSIVSGTLDIELTYDDNGTDTVVDETTILFNDIETGKWEPGVMSVEVLTITNKGNLALDYQLTFDISNDNAASNGKTLADMLKVAIVEGEVELTRDDALLLDYKPIKLFGIKGSMNETTAVSETYTLVVYWEPTEEDSYFNSEDSTVYTIDLGLNLFATQASFEEDYFDDQYDKFASYTFVEVDNSVELVSAISNGYSVVLESDISVAQIVNISKGSDVVVDMNGHTLNIADDFDPAPYTTPYVFLQEYGSKLTITGNGTFDLTGTTASLFIPRGELIVENGTFICEYFRDSDTNPIGSQDLSNIFGGINVGTPTDEKYARVKIYGGYFDGGYYRTDEFVSYNTYAKSGMESVLNLSWGGEFEIYGGTFVTYNPAWGDECGGYVYDPDSTRCQGTFLKGQTITDTTIPVGYEIIEGVTDDEHEQRPTFTVIYTGE